MAGGQGWGRSPCDPTRAAEDDLYPRPRCALGGLTLRATDLHLFYRGPSWAGLAFFYRLGFSSWREDCEEGIGCRHHGGWSPACVARCRGGVFHILRLGPARPRGHP